MNLCQQGRSEERNLFANCEGEKKVSTKIFQLIASPIYFSNKSSYLFFLGLKNDSERCNLLEAMAFFKEFLSGGRVWKVAVVLVDDSCDIHGRTAVEVRSASASWLLGSHP